MSRGLGAEGFGGFGVLGSSLLAFGSKASTVNLER